jgi:hypothetical protein
MPVQVSKHDQPGHGHRGADHGVQQQRADLVAVSALSHREGQFRGRERQHRRSQQQRQVAPQQAGVDISDPGEQRVMVHPHHADVSEGPDVGQVGRPLRQQVVSDVPGAVTGPQVKHQERDRDGQHSVTECLDPVALGQNPRY